MSDTGTQERLLREAEQLFAEQGYERMSLRAVTRRAGANLAAVNYHFGSKRGLIIAVLRRHIEPLNAERLAMLQSARDTAGGQPLPVPTIIDALLEPMARRALRVEGGSRVFFKGLGRMLGEWREFMPMIFREFFTDLAKVSLAELRRTLPELPESELQWRFFFMISTMLGTFARQEALSEIGIPVSEDDLQRQLLPRMRHYVCAGIEAPMSGAPAFTGSQTRPDAVIDDQLRADAVNEGQLRANADVEPTEVAR